MVNYTTEPDRDTAVQRAIWQIRTLYAAVRNNPLAEENSDRIEMIKQLRKKFGLGYFRTRRSE